MASSAALPNSEQHIIIIEVLYSLTLAYKYTRTPTESERGLTGVGETQFKQYGRVPFAFVFVWYGWRSLCCVFCCVFCHSVVCVCVRSANDPTTITQPSSTLRVEKYHFIPYGWYSWRFSLTHSLALGICTYRRAMCTVYTTHSHIPYRTSVRRFSLRMR